MADPEHVTGLLDRRVGFKSSDAISDDIGAIRRPTVGVASDASGDAHLAGLAGRHRDPSASGADVKHQGVAADREHPLEPAVDRLRRDRGRARAPQGYRHDHAGRRLRTSVVPLHGDPPFVRCPLAALRSATSGCRGGGPPGRASRGRAARSAAAPRPLQSSTISPRRNQRVRDARTYPTVCSSTPLGYRYECCTSRRPYARGLRSRGSEIGRTRIAVTPPPRGARVRRHSSVPAGHARRAHGCIPEPSSRQEHVGGPWRRALFAALGAGWRADSGRVRSAQPVCPGPSSSSDSDTGMRGDMEP